MKKYFQFIIKKQELFLVAILLIASLIPRIIAFKPYIYAPPGIGADGGLMAYEIKNHLFMRNAGYPAFAVLGVIFDSISPFPVDIDLSLMSLIAGLGSIFLVYILAKRLIKNIYFAWLAAIVFSLFPVSIYINTTQEIYAVQGFFFLLSLVFLTKKDNLHSIILSGLTFGFATAVHFSTNFALPFFFLFFLWYYREELHYQWKKIFKKIGQWFLAYLSVLIIIFGWMAYCVKLNPQQFIAQVGGDVGLTVWDRISGFFQKNPFLVDNPTEKTRMSSLGFLKASWALLYPRLQASFSNFFLFIVSGSVVVSLLSKKYRFLSLILLLLALSPLYFELDINVGGDSGRFIVMVAPAIALLVGIALKVLTDLCHRFFSFSPKKAFIPFFVIGLLMIVYLISFTIQGKWIFEKDLAKMYHERKIYYLWLKNNFPQKAVFIENTHMPQDGAFYGGPDVVYDDRGNFGILEDYPNNQTWQLTKVVWRFGLGEISDLIQNGIPIYSDDPSSLNRLLSQFPLAEKLIQSKAIYEDFSSPPVKDFLSKFKIQASENSSVKPENNKLVINLKQKNDLNGSVIIDIPDLNLKTGESNIFNLKLKMIAKPELNEHLPKTNLMVNFYEKGQKDADFIFQKELLYDKNENEQILKLNIQDETKGKTIDTIRFDISNFWDVHYQGETKIIINSIGFDYIPKWYEIKEIAREPKANKPLYQVIFDQKILDELKGKKVLEINKEKFLYQDNFESWNWILDSAARSAIEQRGSALMPKIHLRPAEIIYTYQADKPIKSFKISPTIFFNDLSLDPLGTDKNYFKIFVKSEGQNWQEVYSAFSEKNKSTELTPEIDLTKYLLGSQKGEIRFILYSWHINKFQTRGGFNSKLTDLKIEGETKND